MEKLINTAEQRSLKMQGGKIRLENNPIKSFLEVMGIYTKNRIFFVQNEKITFCKIHLKALGQGLSLSVS